MGKELHTSSRSRRLPVATGVLSTFPFRVTVIGASTSIRFTGFGNVSPSILSALFLNTAGGSFSRTEVGPSVESSSQLIRSPEPASTGFTCVTEISSSGFSILFNWILKVSFFVGVIFSSVFGTLWRKKKLDVITDKEQFSIPIECRRTKH